MARYFAVVIALLVGMLPMHVLARPVSYQGGWKLIQSTDRQSTSVWTHYTFTPKFSLGWHSEWDRQQDFIFNGVQATYLAKRWFGENYQANIPRDDK